MGNLKNFRVGITQEHLKELLDYNPKTGIFTWKVRRGGTAVAGSLAGTINSSGYIIIGIDGIRYQAHRIAFLYMTGEFPKNAIDHGNRIKKDNSWNNLEDATWMQNIQNSGNRSTNISGVAGAGWNKQNCAFQAKLRGKHLGYFDSFDEAVCKRLAVEQCLNWNNPNSPASLHVQKLFGRL